MNTPTTDTTADAARDAVVAAYPIGSRWSGVGDEVFEVRGHDVWAGNVLILGGFVCRDGTEGLYVTYRNELPAARFKRVVEPVFKEGDRVTWGTGQTAYTVLASWLHPDTGDTFIVTSQDYTRVWRVGDTRDWRLAESGGAA